jgi:phage/plasmid-like protein (TIGR03299 family)
MPANVETAVYSNEPAWHREGIVLDSNGNKGLTIEQALPASGLDWGVDKTPTLGFGLALKDLNDPKKLKAAIEAGRTISLTDLVINPERFNVQRDSDGKLLGNVGATWDPMNPAPAFAVVDDLITEAGGKTWIEAAGALDGGRKIWIMVHLDNGLQIAGEKYASYLTIVTGFDGRTSTMVFCHDERIVCANTLAIGLNQAKHSDRIIRVRHTKNAADRIKEARHVLEVRNKRAEELARQGEWLVEQSMDDGDFATFLESLMPIKAESGTPAHTMQTDRRGIVARTYFEADNLKPIRGTRWGALQAVIEYADHKRPFKTDETQLKAQFGMTIQSIKIKDDAFSILKTPDLAPIA